MDYLTHQMEFVTTVADLDFRDRLKPSSILQFFQDIAIEHANILGFGLETLLPQNCFWVLTKVSAEILSSPKMYERIKIVTYPRTPAPVEATRDYYIYDSNDNLIVRGTSKWCILDIASKMIRRTMPFFSHLEGANFYPNDAIAGGCTRLKAPERGGDDMGELEVRITDMDRNRHMNNARYADVILNFEDIAWLDDKSVSKFEVNFLSEMPYGGRAKIIRHSEGNKRFFRGVKSDDRDAFFIAVEYDECKK